LFLRGHGPSGALANDTSFGVGFAPLDTLEKMVLAIERSLNAPGTKRAYPEIGADIKVMGARHKDEFAFTIACAFVSQHVTSLADYIEKKSRVGALALQAARTIADVPIEIAVNTADRDTPDGTYLTVTGLSAESGDDGQVGRGNRVNGLITPYRPMSLEAAAGKNPVTHVGKLYNVMASRIAHAVVSEVPEVEEAYCYLLSCIGHPISEPQLFEVKVRFKDTKQHDAWASRIAAVAHTEFAKIDSIWRETVDRTLKLW
jgi:S-adenosylmethionine synthetase